MDKQITCKELVELVTDYLEGSLPEDVRTRMDQHLSGCEGCINYVEQMRQTIRLTGRLREVDLTAQQRDDLLHLFRNWKKT
jgi:anti-sigma factor RsiW